ncbi:uncharacterized protein LOC106663816 isoform X2 [Cimex lectularius]|uniref:PPPDE domain-containing protein n=1 Tax=Cimex lectularius TaxID=79782 RepID=A0A8I6RE12_CIMLE|nr:uncharacterized protein LOC106663816 isoform X2 [Cimex lectularius]
MDEGEDVYLHIYDLSRGKAAALSLQYLDKVIEGIWHTGVVVFGREYSFGSGGIAMALPASLDIPVQQLKLGTTYLPKDVVDSYIQELGQTEFKGSDYDLLKHNCNNFSDTLAQFLVGTGIPEYILNLPNEILNSPLLPILGNLAFELIKSSPIILQDSRRELSPDFQQLNSEIEESRRRSLVLTDKRNALKEKLAKRERKKNKKRRKEERSERYNGRMSEPVEVAQQQEVDPSVRIAENLAEEERLEREERKKNREPPIVYKDAVDVHIEFDALVGLIDGKLNEEEQQSLEELHQYMLQDEGSWALGDSFLVFIGRLLTDPSLGDEASMRCLNVLSAAALKDDVILMLHQDRRQHILMNYAHDVDRLPLPQQRSLTLFICNLFENSGSSEWLLYISEWSYNNMQISNIRVTTKVAVNALLSEDEEMRDRGTAIIYNLATKEVKTVVFDDVAVELTMAILQFLNGSPPEPQLFRCLKAMARFCQISAQDVPQLIQMIGPQPSKFKGQSERNDALIDEITKKLR